jgi:hypothetical protein
MKNFITIWYPKPNAPKDWTKYLCLIKNTFYILHNESKTSLPGENMSKLCQALHSWTTHVFLKDENWFKDLLEMWYAYEEGSKFYNQHQNILSDQETL